jgi:hypothetical protein
MHRRARANRCGNHRFQFVALLLATIFMITGIMLSRITLPTGPAALLLLTRRAHLMIRSTRVRIVRLESPRDDRRSAGCC